MARTSQPMSAMGRARETQSRFGTPRCDGRSSGFSDRGAVSGSRDRHDVGGLGPPRWQAVRAAWGARVRCNRSPGVQPCRHLGGENCRAAGRGRGGRGETAIGAIREPVPVSEAFRVLSVPGELTGRVNLSAQFPSTVNRGRHPRMGLGFASPRSWRR